VRGEQVFEAALELDSGARRILNAEPAEIGTHAGLHHAHGFGVGVARGHAEIRPDPRKVCVLHAEKIMASEQETIHPDPGVKWLMPLRRST
jgi:hypothetical protein